MATLSAGTVTVLYLVVSALVLALWILVAALVGKAAERKLRSFWSFFLIALFISPLLGAVIVAALPPSTEWLVEKGRRRSCPQCGEAVHLSALICPHCQSAASLRHSAPRTGAIDTY